MNTSEVTPKHGRLYRSCPFLLFSDKLKDGGLVSVFRQKTLAAYEGRTTILVSPGKCARKSWSMFM